MTGGGPDSRPGVEFDCTDCGHHIIRLFSPPPSSSRCFSCEWIADTVAVADRAAIRALLDYPGSGAADVQLPPHYRRAAGSRGRVS